MQRGVTSRSGHPVERATRALSVTWGRPFACSFSSLGQTEATPHSPRSVMPLHKLTLSWRSLLRWGLALSNQASLMSGIPSRTRVSRLGKPVTKAFSSASPSTPRHSEMSSLLSAFPWSTTRPLPNPQRGVATAKFLEKREGTTERWCVCVCVCGGGGWGGVGVVCRGDIGGPALLSMQF
jgi:hypothetical protein